MKKKKIIVIFSTHLSEEENEKFVSHIDSTIGVDHSVHYYVNYNTHSLPEIYNKAIEEHNEEGAIMVFCHNDIIFKTKNWGKYLLAKFNHLDYQIIGVAGSTYMPESGRWWDDPSKMVGIVEHTNGLREWVSEYCKPFGGVKETVLIDGLFMAVDCNDIEDRFDEDFKGFHFYDISFCVPNWLDGVNVGVVTDIRILHKSVGMTNQEWENNRIQFVEKYKADLPLTVFPPVKEIKKKLTKEPKVSVIIPTKNNFKYLSKNIFSWQDQVKYDNYEIIIADTGSDEEVIKSYDELLSDKVRLVKYDYFNFAKINNDVVKNHVPEDTELILFCNDDIFLLNDALSRCVEIYNSRSDSVGTIGIRLHFGDGSIQHNGISIFRNNQNQVMISHVDFKKTDGYKTEVNYSSIGNTAAFLMIKKELFNKIGGFNEKYSECFEDVELNLECFLNKKKNITVSDATAFHYESVSRKKSEEKNKRERDDYINRLYPFIMNHINVLGRHIPKVR